MASVRTAEKLIDAMRLVAAARIRAATSAALAARPFADRLQGTLGALVANIRAEGVDVAAIAAAARHDAFVVLASGGVTVDRLAQRALMDQLYLCLLDVSPADAAGVAGDSMRDDRVPSAMSYAGLRDYVASGAPQDPPLPPPPPPATADATTTLLVVISGDRGFCGSYNKDVLARAVARMRALQQSHPSRTVELVLVGKSAITFFSRRYPDVHVRFKTEVGQPAAASATTARVCDSVLSQFIAGELERVEVVYTRFTSLVSNTPAVRTLLPVTPSGLEVADDEIFQLTSRNGKLFVAPTRIDTSPGVAVASSRERQWGDEVPPRYAISAEGSILLLNAMLPMYVHSQLTRTLRDSIAAELSCRMNAMNAATDNCRDISKALKSTYDRERQQRITAEVIMLSGPRE